MTIEDRKYCIKHGYCTKCGEVKADKGYRTCQACRIRWREYEHSRTERMSSEERSKRRDYNKKYHREQRAARKEKGLCTECGKPAEYGKVRCKQCLEKDRVATRKRRGSMPRYMFGDGYHCSCCGRPTIGGKKSCDSCYQKHCESLRKANAVRKEISMRLV